MIEEKIAKDLLSIGAVFLRPEEPFTWASGIKSPVYCDNRLTLTAPAVRNERGDYHVISETGLSDYDPIAALLFLAAYLRAGVSHVIDLACLGIAACLINAECILHIDDSFSLFVSIN